MGQNIKDLLRFRTISNFATNISETNKDILNQTNTKSTDIPPDGKLFYAQAESSVCLSLTVESRVGRTTTASVAAERIDVAVSQGLRRVEVRSQGTVAPDMNTTIENKTRLDCD